RVLWSEGLLMAPQHLQCADAFHEGALQARLDAVEPLNWGVISAALDDQALNREQVSLSRFEGIMPDGTLLAIGPGHPELPPARPLDQHFPINQQTLDVFLAVPLEREGRPNADDVRGKGARYFVDTRSVHDRYGAAAAHSVQVANRNVVLLFGDEPREGFTSIKVFEIVRTDAGGLALSDPYIPPCVRISASPFLMSGLRRLLSAMSTRRAALGRARRERGDASVEYNAADVTRYLLLNAVNTYLPVVNHLVDSEDFSPRRTYLLLTQLAGQLSTFSADFDPLSIPKFKYTDLRDTFESLFAVLMSLLHASVKEHFVAVTLEARADGMHLGEFKDNRLFECGEFLLGVRAKLSDGEVGTQLPRLSKIASWQDINALLASAVPGAPVEVTYTPPAQVPVRAGTTYFRVKIDNQFWRNVMVERKLAVYLPSPFTASDTQIELYGVLGGRQ
ncbi:MAG: type VI secretion system baseplate subunit TssK, partial [Myxococcales bacterium]|nr:type VI secretion system baseplate subunit TssK [Myxococcales bacterium]